MIAILHIADLHFGKRAQELFPVLDRLAHSVVDALDVRWWEAEERILVISGDLVWQGDRAAFSVATRFLRDLGQRLQVQQDRLVLCPGNHDLVRGEDDPFQSFNHVVHKLTGDTGLLFTPDRPGWIRQIGGVTFLVLNSAYHFDHTFGLVDIDGLDFAGASGGPKPRIAVLHHNLIGIDRADTSTVRNAYPLLLRLVNEEFDVVLHGHQHASEVLPLGSGYNVGVGSLNLLSWNGMPNQFNLLLWDGELVIERYTYMGDLGRRGRMSGWMCTTLLEGRGP